MIKNLAVLDWTLCLIYICRNMYTAGWTVSKLIELKRQCRTLQLLLQCADFIHILCGTCSDVSAHITVGIYGESGRTSQQDATIHTNTELRIRQEPQNLKDWVVTTVKLKRSRASLMHSFGHFDPWRWEEWTGSKHRCSITRWTRRRSVVSQTKGLLGYADANASKLATNL
jgi:hypothetical protein